MNKIGLPYHFNKNQFILQFLRLLVYKRDILYVKKIHKIKLKQAYNERVLSNAFRDDSS